MIALLAAGCTGLEQSRAPAATEAAEPASAKPLRERPPAQDAARYSIITSQSKVSILTFREGTLARLGHNHVISSAGVTGTVWFGESLAEGLVRIVIPTSSLSVDEPDERAVAGDAFVDPVPEDARTATRDNMLSEALLDADNFAFIRVSCGDLVEATESTIDCDVELAGTRVRLALPISVEVEPTRISARGSVTVTHEQLGLTPFSAAGGAIRVADAMTLSYDIVAQRLSD